MDELSDQELQFLQTLREQTGNVDFSVLIARRAALWTITLSHTVGSKLLVDSGEGATFSDAWERVGGDWPKRPRLEIVVDNDK
jgi:hypothetical protein